MTQIMDRKRQGSRLRLIAATGLGNFLETYDFTVYSYFATIIGLTILKTDDPALSTAVSTALFGLGFLARPLGSLILGLYADNHGRKAALLVSICLMGLGSACIGFAPPYAAAGLSAPLMALLGRLLQGFSAGGELGSAASLLMESAEPKRRGLFVGWQFTMQGISAAGGALTAYILFSSLSPAALQSWGWRVPFFIALLIIPAGLYIRAHIDETYAGNYAAAKSKARSAPLRLIWRENRRLFIFAALSTMPITLLVYIMVLYMPSYLSLIQIHSGAAFLSQGSGRFALTAGAGLGLAAATILGGWLCDKFTARKPAALICLAAAFIGAFAVYASVGKNFALFLTALSLVILALGMLMTIQALMALEAFPRAARATGMALSLSLGATLFGGTAQVIVSGLMLATYKAVMTPFYYLGPMLIIGFIIFALFPERRP